MPGQFLWVTDPNVPSNDLQGDLPPWPQDVLDRHGLRVLRPAEAVPDPRPQGGDTRPTVYRVETLLMPERLLRPEPDGGENKTLAVITEVLSGGGFAVAPPTRIDELDHDTAPLLDELTELPRPFVLKALKADLVVDAWTALQVLRRALIDGHFTGYDEAAVNEISLEHALTGTEWGPAPTGESHGVPDTVPIGTRSGYGRRPVDVLLTAPHRPKPAGTRRPVVFVLDTGYGPHPWLGVDSAAGNLPQGGFLRTSQFTQDLIDAQSAQVKGLARTGVLLQGAREDPPYGNELTRTVAAATGHGTFIAGIIHQQAPCADVVAIRVLRSDGVAYESDVLLALWIMSARLKRQPTAQDAVVDVVSISLGFYPESPQDAQRTRIAEVTATLLDAGVLIVAAAGNDSTARPFLPASLAFDAGRPVDRRVVGCGALNPNGSIAWFSNGGCNANCYAPGAGIVSTFPNDIRGSVSPNLAVQGNNRATMDLDDYSTGFAVWSGTSFATPVVAARLANLIAEDPVSRMPRSIDDHGEQAMIARAEDSVRRLRDGARRWP